MVSGFVLPNSSQLLLEWPSRVKGAHHTQFVLVLGYDALYDSDIAALHSWPAPHEVYMLNATKSAFASVSLRLALHLSFDVGVLVCASCTAIC